jgi:hypothetical protein
MLLCKGAPDCWSSEFLFPICRRVLVVLGRFCGQRAKLLKRDSAAGTVVVQLTADYSAQELSFDEVSEYVGELGEEE